MQNTAQFYDITFILDKIGWINREEKKLSEKQKRKIKKLHPKNHEEIEKKILQKQKAQKEDLLYMWAIILEEKVRSARLPKKIAAQILEFATSVKNGVTAVFNTDNKVSTLKESVTKSIQKENLAENQSSKRTSKKGNAPEDVFTDETVHSVIAPFVQVRHTKEKFEKAAQAFFKGKILAELAMSETNPIVPKEPKREYPQKQGTQYPKSAIKLKQTHTNQWLKLLVEKVQKQQAQSGQRVQTPEEILASHENMCPMKKKIILQALKAENPELARRQEIEEQLEYTVHLKKNAQKQLQQKEIKKLIAEKKRKQEFDRAVQSYVKEHILTDLTLGKTGGQTSSEQLYPQASTKAEIELQKEQEKELLACFVKKIQKQQAKAGQPIQTPEAILASYENMSTRNKSYTLQAIRSWNIEIARKQEEEKKILEQKALQKSIERLRRKHQKKKKQDPNILPPPGPQQKKTVKERLSKGQKEGQNEEQSETKSVLDRLEQGQKYTPIPDSEHQL